MHLSTMLPSPYLPLQDPLFIPSDMTGKRDGFLSYRPLSSGIKLADGSLYSDGASGIDIYPLYSSPK